MFFSYKSRPNPLALILVALCSMLIASSAFGSLGAEDELGKPTIDIIDPQAEGFTPTTVRMSWKITGNAEPDPLFYRIYRSDENGAIIGSPVAESVQNDDWQSWPRLLWTAIELEPETTYCHVLVPVFPAAGQKLGGVDGGFVGGETEGDPSPPACATTPPANGADWHLLPPPMASIDGLWLTFNPEWRLYAAHRWSVNEETVISYLGDIAADHMPYVLPEGVRNVIDGSIGECIGEHLNWPFEWEAQACLANAIENGIKEASGRGDSLDAADRGILGCVAAEAGGLASGFLFDRPENFEKFKRFIKKEAVRGCVTTGVKDSLTNPVALTWGEWTQNWITRSFWDGLAAGALSMNWGEAVRAGGVEFVKYALTNSRPPDVPDHWLFWYFWLTHFDEGQAGGLTPAARSALETVVDWAQAEQCQCLPAPVMTVEQVEGLVNYLVEPQTRPTHPTNPNFLLTGTVANPPSWPVLRIFYQQWEQWMATHDAVAHSFYVGGPAYNRHAGYFSWLFSNATASGTWHRCWTTPPSYDYATCGEAAPAGPEILVARFIDANRLEVEWRDRAENEGGFRLYLEKVGFEGSAMNFDPLPGSGESFRTVVTVDPGFEYCAKVGAFNGTGISTLSEELCDDYGGDPEVYPPSNLKATPLTNHSIRLDWTPSVDATRYTVYEEGTLSPLLRLTDGESALIEGLPAGRSACFDVYAWLWPIYSSEAATACATTFAGPPAAPSELRVEGMGRTVAVLSWNDHSANEETWPVKIRKDLQTVTYRYLPGSEGTGRRIAVVDGLDPDADYIFQIKARGADGLDSAWTDTAGGVTHRGKPEPVQLDSWLLGDGRVRFIWQGGEGADYFQVFRTFDQGPTYELRPDQFELDVDVDLSSCWKIWAVNGEGYSEDQLCVDGLLLPPPFPAAETVDETRIRFTWEAVPGVDGYELWDLSNRLLGTVSGDQTTSWITEVGRGERQCLVIYSSLGGDLSAASDVVCGYSMPRTTVLSDLVWLDLESTALYWGLAEPWEWMDVEGWDRESGERQVFGSAPPGSTSWEFFRPQSTSGLICYQIRRRNPGGPGPWTEPHCQYAYPQPPPTKPTVVSVQLPGPNDCDELRIRWTDEIEGEDRFELAISGELNIAVDPDIQEAIVGDRAPGYGYEVRVRAREGLDAATAWSKAGVGATCMPVAVWESVTPADQWLELDWSHAFESHWAVVGYEVWQIVEGAQSRLLRTTQNTETSFHLSEFEGQDPCLAIKTLGHARDSLLSITRCVEAPSPVVATPMGCDGPECGISLSWTYGGGVEAEGFIVKAWADPPFGASGWIDWPGVVPADSRELYWNDLVDDWHYCFFVAALEDGGQTPFSEEGPRSCATAGDPPPDVLVLEPNGGEVLTRGEAVDVRWQSALADPEMTLRLLRGEDFWRTIEAGTASSGLYPWQLPNDPDAYPEADDYRLEICGTTSGLCGRSDHAFRIRAPLPGPSPAIQLEAPNGGEIWQTGSTRKVTWTAQPAIEEVQIDLYRGDTHIGPLTYGTVNDGSWNWQIATHLESCDYKLRICDTASIGVCDWSDGHFGLSGPDVPQAPGDVRAEPGPGEGKVRVYWRDESTTEEHFEIRVLRPGSVETIRVDGRCGGDGAPLWRSFNAPGGDPVCFQVRALNENGHSAWKPLIAKCAEPEDVPAAPSNVEALGGPGSVDVRFKDRSDNEEGFDVEVWSGEGTTLLDLVKLPANRESYRVEPLGTDARRCFRVRAAGAAGQSQWVPAMPSEACATAETEPALRLIEPSAGDILRLGDPFRIRWEWGHGATPEPVHVELVRGGARTIADIAEGEFLWEVDNFSWPPGSRDFRIRVTGLDSERSAESGEFTIKHHDPEPPGDVRAVGGPGRVRVLWQDRSNEEHGFRVKIFSGNGTELDVVEVHPSLGAAANRHHDIEGLGMSTERCVQVQAYNSAESDWVPANSTLACDVSAGLEVSSPASGATWRVGETRAISWHWSNYGGKVDLQLYRSTGNFEKEPIGVIASSVTGGTWPWTVSNLGNPLSGKYVVVARSVTEPDFYAVSDPFNLLEQPPANPTIDGIEGGVNRVTLHFLDRADNEYGYRVRVLTGGGTELQTAELSPLVGVGKVGSFEAAASGSAVERCFQVQAFNTEQGAWVPSSPLQACGHSSSLAVTAPAAGALWHIGEMRTITWQRSSFEGPVDLELWRGGGRLGIVASGLGGSSYSWTVDAFGQQVGHGDYRLRVVSAEQPTFFAESADFTLREQTPTAPQWLDVNGGPGSVSFRFRDQSENEYEFQVRYYNGSSTHLGTATLDAVSGTGTELTYTITGLQQGVERCFKVRARNTSASDWSPGSAAIACASSSSLTVTEPSGGEIWRTGETRQIQWQRLNFDGEVKAELLKANVVIGEIGRTTGDSLSFIVERFGQAWGHDFKVRVSAVSEASLFDNAGVLTLRDQPPAPPSGVSAEGGQRQITASWQDGSDNETSFDVEIYSGAGTLLETRSVTANSTQTTVTGLGDEVERCFRVRARNSDESPWVPSATHQACATTDPPLGTPPERPESVSVEGQDGRFLISWSHSQTDTDGFRIRQIDPATGAQQTANAPLALSWTWNGFSPGVTRCFQVQAFNEHGSSAYEPSSATEVCAATLSPPPTPSWLGAEGLQGQVRATWQNVSGETGYDLEIYTSSGTWLQTVDLDVDETQRSVSVGDSVTRCFRVRAKNAIGSSGWRPSSPTFQCATSNPPQSTVPARPQNVQASGGNGWLRVEWAHDFTDAQGFRVEAYDAAGGFIERVEAGLAHSKIFSSVGSGETRCFRVEAYNQHGGSGYEPVSTTAVCATSNVVPRSVDLHHPTGGETWHQGDYRTISWSRSGGVTHVAVYLYINGFYDRELTPGNCSGVDADSFSWSIPASLANGSNYQIKIEEAHPDCAGAASDISGNFRICSGGACPQ